MKLSVRLPKDDPGRDNVIIQVKKSDTFRDIQRAIVSKYIEDISEYEMEQDVWRTRYYIYLVEGNVSRPASIAPMENDTVSEFNLSDGQKIALDFQENNPDTVRYICPDCATNDNVNFRPVRKEQTARPAPTHECGYKMSIDKDN